MDENPSAKKHMINVFDYLLSVETGLEVERDDETE